jgi:hypothetical protein
MDWQPIDTAPKTERHVLLAGPGLDGAGPYVADGYFQRDSPAMTWVLFTNRSRVGEPTHWMPLPEPPVVVP